MSMVKRADGRGRRGRWTSIRLLAVLCIVLLSSLADRPAALATGSWTAAFHMLEGRSHAVAVLLSDGRVLAAGGNSQVGSLRSVTADAEIYNPATRTWTPAAPMVMPRADFTGTLLHDGRVLVAGGTTGTTCLSSAELYDPGTGTWSSAGTMSAGRCNHTATLLNDGRVLVTGGFDAGSPLSSCEVYDPATNSWSPTEDMRVARGDHTATLRDDGKVLVVGGYGASGPLASVELYDPASGHWTGFVPLPGLLHPRYSHTATLLPDGRVLVAGGLDATGPLSSAELYDPGTGFWTAARPMSVPRALHTATLVPNGQVLVAGGLTAGPAYTASSELYDPAAGSWSPAGSMAVGRAAHTATLLAGGDVLVAGGTNGAQDLDETEVYTSGGTATPSPGGATATPARTPTPTAGVPPPPPPPTGTVTALPTSPSTTVFSIRSVRVEKYGSTPDWSLTRSPLKRVAAGTRVLLSIYVSLTSIAPSSSVSVLATVRRAGRVTFRGALSEERSSPGDLVYRWSFTPHLAGRYSITGRVTIGGQTAHTSTTLIARAPAVSFSFDRLVALDQHGRVAGSFPRNGRVNLVATITVRHAASPVRLNVGQTLEYWTGSVWAPLGRRVQNSFVTANGRHTYTVTFSPQSPYSLLRMVLDVTLGHVTRSRSVAFKVY